MKKMKNILMIVVDCARGEKTVLDLPRSTPGTRRSARLPFLEFLRSRGTTWTNFHSVSSTTSPNFASMFTGRLPVRHGIKEHSRYSLLEEVETVAEILGHHGYHTYAEVSGPLIPETGLNRGFMHYRTRERQEYLHRGFLQYLGDFFPRLQEPWFLVLHFWEAHQPYQNPEPFNTPDFGQTAYDRALSFVDHYLHLMFREVDFRGTSLLYMGDHGERLPEDYLLNEQLGGNEKAVLELYQRFSREQRNGFDYDGWYAALEKELGDVTAKIYAHNVVGHGFHLTEDLVRVPLIIVDEEHTRPGRISRELRSQTDIFATLLDLAGIEKIPGEVPESTSLFKPTEQEKIYIEANGSGGKKFESRCYLRGAKSNRWKYWRVEAEGVTHRVLWDLESDPRETHNVIETYPEIASEMEQFVDEQLEDNRSHFVDINSKEAQIIEERLRDLGYIE